MKINAITIAAVGVAGLAVASWAHNRSSAAPSGQTMDGPDSGGYFNNLTQQHDTVQSATSQNIDYLKNWQDLSNAWGNDPNLWL